MNSVSLKGASLFKNIIRIESASVRGSHFCVYP